jgi:hypothetical protein
LSLQVQFYASCEAHDRIHPFPPKCPEFYLPEDVNLAMLSTTVDRSAGVHWIAYQASGACPSHVCCPALERAAGAASAGRRPNTAKGTLVTGVHRAAGKKSPQEADVGSLAGSLNGHPAASCMDLLEHGMLSRDSIQFIACLHRTGHPTPPRTQPSLQVDDQLVVPSCHACPLNDCAVTEPSMQRRRFDDRCDYFTVKSNAGGRRCIETRLCDSTLA